MQHILSKSHIQMKTMVKLLWPRLWLKLWTSHHLSRSLLLSEVRQFLWPLFMCVLCLICCDCVRESALTPSSCSKSQPNNMMMHLMAVCAIHIFLGSSSFLSSFLPLLHTQFPAQWCVYVDYDLFGIYIRIEVCLFCILQNPIKW